MRRNEEANTVVYSGPDLDELLAASGERPVVVEPELEVDIETTVVIPGSRRTFAPPQSALASGSYPALAYTISQEAAIVVPRRGSARDYRAFILGATALLFALSIAMSIQAEPVRARAAARQVQNTRVSETTALLSPTLQKAEKAAPKRANRASSSVTRATVRPLAAAVAPHAEDASEDPQLAADRQLVLAAQREQSL